MNRDKFEEIKKAYGYGYKLDINTYPHWFISRIHQLEKELLFVNEQRIYYKIQNEQYRKAIEEAMELNHDANFNYDVDKVLLKALESDSE